MVDAADQDFLRSIFLMEAWDTLASLEDGVTRLAGGRRAGVGRSVRRHASSQGRGVAPRLPARGGAGRDDGAIAEAADRWRRPRRAPRRPPRSTPTMNALKSALESVERDAEPEAPTRWRRRRRRRSCSAAALVEPDPLPASRAAIRSGTSSCASSRGATRSSATSCPEAAEHLETMTASLLDARPTTGGSDPSVAARCSVPSTRSRAPLTSSAARRWARWPTASRICWWRSAPAGSR